MFGSAESSYSDFWRSRLASGWSHDSRKDQEFSCEWVLLWALAPVDSPAFPGEGGHETVTSHNSREQGVAFRISDQQVEDIVLGLESGGSLPSAEDVVGVLAGAMTPGNNGSKLGTPRQQRRSDSISTIVNDLAPYWPLTVRQIHYQAFSSGIEWDIRNGATKPYQNTQNQYKALSRLLTAMRVEGAIPWEAIQDTTRRVSDKRGVEDISANLDEATAWLDPERYERCLIQGQETYVEVWSEKEALFGILHRVTDDYCLRLASCRGFSSSTMAYEYCEKRAKPALQKGQQPVILFLSDFDPSGMDMLGAIERKVEQEVGVYGVVYERVALTPEQIEMFDLPHNPEALKAGDSRAPKFIRHYGNSSVELDALHPKQLQKIARDAIESHVDTDLMDEQREIESEDRERLAVFAQEFRRLREKHRI
jgi:hypothetical protein